MSVEQLREPIPVELWDFNVEVRDRILRAHGLDPAEWHRRGKEPAEPDEGGEE